MGDHQDTHLPGLPVGEPTRYKVTGRVVYRQVKCVEATCDCGGENVLLNPRGAEALEHGQDVLIRCGKCGAHLITSKATRPLIAVPQIVLARQ